jgi:hypothetical protein
MAPSPGFAASSLWQTTLAEQPGDIHVEQRTRLRVSYLSLRERASTLMAQAPQDALPYTVHDITHADALWEAADEICGPQISITPLEGYILGCAFVLHDAAMCQAAYKDGLDAAFGKQEWRDLLALTHFQHYGNWPEPTELDAPTPAVRDDCRFQAIREIHPRHAKTLVAESWPTQTGSTMYLIDDAELRETYGDIIGNLAASHWDNVKDLIEPFQQERGPHPMHPPEWRIEPLKLACILRLADAAQIDSRRAPTFLFALRRPKGPSRDHWSFQQFVGRPFRRDDRLHITSLRPFTADNAHAWWLALDYLREVDAEFKRVDALLYDLKLKRMAVRAVAGVDDEKRFADVLPVSGWRPVDARLQISDAPGLVDHLGGTQLYGNAPQVAVRELIQNAHDAVAARARLESEFIGGRIEVQLTEADDGNWTLEVRDNGVGMDEDIIAHALLDFGRSGWSSRQARTKFPGLPGGGFQPKGRFGIGFFAVFMLGDDIEITTRRYDGATTDALHVTFSGLLARPIITTPRPTPATRIGTTVRVRLKENPYNEAGLFRFHVGEQSLFGLVRTAVVDNTVPVLTTQYTQDAEEIHRTLEPLSLRTASPKQIFDRLHPKRPREDSVREKQRLMRRERFASHATEILDTQGRRAGFASLEPRHEMQYSRFLFPGTLAVSGFRADDLFSFEGFLEGRPNRASRDRAELAVQADSVQSWFTTQITRWRELGEYTASTQVQTAEMLYQVFGRLSDEHAIGATSDGLIRFGSIGEWAEHTDEIFLTSDWPLAWNYSSPEAPFVWHIMRSAKISIPDKWLITGSRFSSLQGPFYELFPSARLRDPRFEAWRFSDGCWQQNWWYSSGSFRGKILMQICDAWSCDIEDIYAPVCQRHFEDYSHIDPDVEPAWGYWLRRPGA